eukprot:SAG11_NODE_82_length_17639_cov_6.427594_5_plen_448_part_00
MGLSPWRLLLDLACLPATAAVLPSPRDLGRASAWAERLAPRRDDDATSHHFTFEFGGQSSEALLRRWPRATRCVNTTGISDICTTTWHDPASGLTVSSEATCFIPGSHPAVWWALRFANNGTGPTPILTDVRAAAITVPVGAGDAVLRYPSGSNAAPNDFQPREVALPGGAASSATLPPQRQCSGLPSDGQASPSTPGHGYAGGLAAGAAPFFRFDHADGASTLFAVGWTGMWQANISRSVGGAVHLQAGTAAGFGSWQDCDLGRNPPPAPLPPVTPSQLAQCKSQAVAIDNHSNWLPGSDYVRMVTLSGSVAARLANPKRITIAGQPRGAQGLGSFLQLPGKLLLRPEVPELQRQYQPAELDLRGAELQERHHVLLSEVRRSRLPERRAPPRLAMALGRRIPGESHAERVSTPATGGPPEAPRSPRCAAARRELPDAVDRAGHSCR